MEADYALSREALRRLVSRILAIPTEDLDASQPLHVQCIDSLTSVESRNRFEQVLKVDVAVFESLGGAMVSTLGREVAEKLFVKALRLVLTGTARCLLQYTESFVGSQPLLMFLPVQDKCSRRRPHRYR